MQHLLVLLSCYNQSISQSRNLFNSLKEQLKHSIIRSYKTWKLQCT